MTLAGWVDLVDELNRWQQAGRVATFWWRDDDVIASSPKLDHLSRLAASVPIALAAIPAAAEPELAAWLRQSGGRVAVLQHGWRHLDHSDAGKKSEFPRTRAFGDVQADLLAGRVRLSSLFEDLVVPVLVPPWNRFDDSFLQLLPTCGFCGISRIKPRPAASPCPGLAAVNVHVDLVAWKHGRGFIGTGGALGGVVGHLQARRLREVCADEPTGILTHHLLLDEAASIFLTELVAITRAHPAARWCEAAEIFRQRTLVAV